MDEIGDSLSRSQDRSHEVPVQDLDYSPLEIVFLDRIDLSRVSRYIQDRFVSVERRMLEAFRFVACHPDNEGTFSFEFSSILRDVGSVFGSAMQRIVAYAEPANNDFDMNDYKEWLSTKPLKQVIVDGSKLDYVGRAVAELNIVQNRRFLRKFMPHASHSGTPRWWKAYNNVKHSDIDRFRDGNLGNCLHGIAALATLWIICDRSNVQFHIFRRIGLFPQTEILNYSFCGDDST